MTNDTASDVRVGWIGTGVMGASMLGHLIEAGHPAAVFTRTRERAEPLLAKGARWADSPAAVAREADVVFSIVGVPADVREVILGPEGALAGAASGATLVDMTTSEPSREVRDRAHCRRGQARLCEGDCAGREYAEALAGRYRRDRCQAAIGSAGRCVVVRI